MAYTLKLKYKDFTLMKKSPVICFSKKKNPRIKNENERPKKDKPNK